MTETQKKLYDYLASRTDNPVGPSYDEMVSATGISSKSGISRLLSELKERGLVDFIPNKSRSARILEKSDIVEAARKKELILNISYLEQFDHCQTAAQKLRKKLRNMQLKEEARR